MEVLKKYDRWVLYPLVGDIIEDIDYIENRDIVDGMLKKYKRKDDWKEICKKCKWHNY